MTKLDNLKTISEYLNKYYVIHNKIKEHKEFLELEKEEQSQINNSKKHRVNNPHHNRLRYKSSTINKSSIKFWLIVFILIVIFCFVILGSFSGGSNNTITPAGESNPEPPDCSSPANGQTYNSLANGYQISNSSYFNGQGQLKITNGTNDNAVVKIINTVTNTSLDEFSIDSNNKYNIVVFLTVTTVLFFSLCENFGMHLSTIFCLSVFF